MDRKWQSVFILGLFILAFVLVVLLYKPNPGPVEGYITIETRRDSATGNVRIAKMITSLNDQERLDDFPYRIGNWEGTDYWQSKYLRESLKADVLLMREYHRTDQFSQPIELLIINSGRSTSVHMPIHCFNFLGYTIGEESYDSINIEDTSLVELINESGSDAVRKWFFTELKFPAYDAEIPINKLEVYKTRDNQIIERRLVLYCYLKDPGFIGNEFGMLRVSALIQDYGRYDDIELLLKDFMRETFSLLFKSYHEEQDRIIVLIAGFGAWGYFAISILFLVPLTMVIYPMATGKLPFFRRRENGIKHEKDKAGSIADKRRAEPENRSNTPKQSVLPFDLTGKTGRDKILGAYQNSRWLIEKATSISVESDITLRDFVNNVSPRLPAQVASDFAELTRIVEAVLYSVSEQDESVVSKAVYLSHSIIDVMSDGLTDQSRNNQGK